MYWIAFFTGMIGAPALFVGIGLWLERDGRIE